MSTLTGNMIANYAGRAWTVLLGVVLIPVYLGFIGVEAYGLVGFYTALSSVLGILDLGMGLAMNRELARLSAVQGSAGSQRDVVRTLEVIYWGIALAAGGAVVLLAPLISKNWIQAQNLDPDSVTGAVRLMGMAIALHFPASLYQGGLMGLQRQVLLNVILVSTATMRSAGVILVLWLVSPTVETFFAWHVAANLAGSAAFLVAVWSCLPKHPVRARFRRSVISGLWRYAAAVSANAVIGIALTQTDKVILSKMLSLKMFGYYSIAATVASAVWMITLPFNNAVFPRFVQLHEKGLSDELRAFFHKSTQFLSFLLFPSCAVLILFSREILFLWVKDSSVLENCHMIVSFLVLGTMLNGVVSIPAYSSSAFGWPQLVMYTNLFQAFIMIPVIVGMVLWLQGVGAAIAWVILNSTYVLFMVPVYFRRYLNGEMAKWYLVDILAPAAAAFAVCLVSAAISPAVHTTLSASIWLAATALAAFVAAGVILPEVRSRTLVFCSGFARR